MEIHVMNKQNSYAIIESGSKQYRVQIGDVIDVEKLSCEEGASVDFAQVLAFHDGSSVKIGAPCIEKALVRGECLGDVRGEKVIAYKYKRRKNYHRKVGHRQDYKRIKIVEFVRE
jgi:large subunit ribosomal protein L21